MFTLQDIYFKYKCKYKQQETDQQCCRKWWLTFFCMFSKQTPGWHLQFTAVWLNRCWHPLVRVHSTDLFTSHSSTSALPLPVSLPLFLNSSILLVFQFCPSSCSYFLFPTSSIPSNPQNPQLLCTAPLTAAWCIHPQQPTFTAVNLNTNLSPTLKIFPQDGFSTANCEIWLLVKAKFAENQSYWEPKKTTGAVNVHFRICISIKEATHSKVFLHLHPSHFR